MIKCFQLVINNQSGFANAAPHHFMKAIKISLGVYWHQLSEGTSVD